MRNPKVNIFKATAAFLVILAAVFYYYEEIKEPEMKIETTEVVVAVSDIPENTVIKKEMVTTEKRYTEDVIKTGNIAKSYDEIVGKRTVVPIYKGEPVNISRIIENKNYMNDKDQTQIAIALNEVDKALELHPGDYIDIWLEPIAQGQDIQAAGPYKLIEKIEIINVHDSNYDVSQEATNAESIKTNDTYVPAYFTVELPDTTLKELYSVDKNIYNIRVTRYGDEKLLRTVTNILQGGDYNAENKLHRQDIQKR